MGTIGFGLLLLLGTASALDGTSVGQVLLSRPLVAGLLAGLVLGDPVMAIPLALTMEFYQLAAVPAGGSRFPEGGVGTVVGVALTHQVGGGEGLILGLGLAFLWAELGGRSIVWHRRVNGKRWAQLEAAGISLRSLEAFHRGALVRDSLRGMLVTGGGIVLAAWGAGWVRGATMLPPSFIAGVIGLLAVPALAVIYGVLRPGRRRHLLFVGGTALGLLGGWLW